MDLEREYADLHAIAETKAAALRARLTEIAHAEQIELAMPVAVRVKELRSVVEKAERLGARFPRTLSALDDLIGARVVVMLRAETTRLADALYRNLRIIKRIDADARHGSDQFGYLSIHLVADALPDAKNSLRAEIQLRTLTQHVWASASHRLMYKAERDVTPAFLRSMNRLAALLELADLEFQRAADERADVFSTTDFPNDEHLYLIMMQYVLMDLFPAQNLDPDADYDVLLLECIRHGVETKGQFVEVMRRHPRSGAPRRIANS